MNASWSINPSQARRKRRNRRLLLLAFSLVVIFGFYFASKTESSPHQDSAFAEQVEDSNASVTEADASEPVEVVPDNIIVRNIQTGDNLSAIFDSIYVSQVVLLQILDADESILALDVLHPGNSLTFTLDETTRELQQMELFIHLGKQVIYRQSDDGGFVYEEVVTPGVWEQQLISGEINGSFYLSAMDAGLSEQETANISELFAGKLNFGRDMRAGDQFQVIRKQQYVEGEYTGQSLVEGVRIFNQNQTYTAFLFEDGNYYDSKGESLASAFRRYPFSGTYRISSPYNLKRLHPVTGKISPHLGTDFAMSTGTSVLATGDGVITRVKDHLYAGKYIEIKHSGQYVTRYLHLSKILVTQGQKVTRGQKIALSGNTGRSTGAHLHYELRIKGNAVNAMTANIPMASAIPDEKQQVYKSQIAGLIQLMEAPQQVAQSNEVMDATH